MLILNLHNRVRMSGCRKLHNLSETSNIFMNYTFGCAFSFGETLSVQYTDSSVPELFFPNLMKIASFILV